MTGCIFCGRSPLTNAHIFRKAWLAEVMPGLESDPYVHHHIREGGFEAWWNNSEADLKVNDVCDPCNSGWMDRLDRAAEAAFLDVAVRGFPHRLSKLADQVLVARWCLLVAALASRTQALTVWRCNPFSVNRRRCRVSLLLQKRNNRVTRSRRRRRCRLGVGSGPKMANPC